MKKYLLVKHWMNDKETRMTDIIEKKHLLDLKQRMCEAIINTEDGTYFVPEKNKWVKIKLNDDENKGGENNDS